MSMWPNSIQIIRTGLIRIWMWQSEKDDKGTNMSLYSFFVRVLFHVLYKGKSLCVKSHEAWRSSPFEVFQITSKRRVTLFSNAKWRDFYFECQTTWLSFWMPNYGYLTDEQLLSILNFWGLSELSGSDIEHCNFRFALTNRLPWLILVYFN